MRETGRIIDFGNLLLIHQGFTPRSKEERRNHKLRHRRMCVTFKPKKQLIRGVSCTKNCFP